jgi:hypothetical protein
MRFRTYPNTPLWFDLLLATGAITLAQLLDQVIRPPRRVPRFDKAFPQKIGSGHITITALTPKRGAIGRRPSQEPHRLQQARAEEAGRARSARSPITVPASGWKDIPQKNLAYSPRRAPISYWTPIGFDRDAPRHTIFA